MPQIKMTVLEGKPDGRQFTMNDVATVPRVGERFTWYATAKPGLLSPVLLDGTVERVEWRVDHVEWGMDCDGNMEAHVTLAEATPGLAAGQ